MRFRLNGWVTLQTSALVVASTFLTACSSVPLASSQADYQAKQFQVERDSSVLYIVQDGGYAPGMALFQISVDGIPQGSLAGATFHRVVVKPGEHTVVGTSPENENGIRVVAPAGKLVFISVPSSAGWRQMRVGDMRVIDESAGKQAVLNSDLARGFN